MLDDELIAQARSLLDLCRGKKLTIAVAESCTGGLLSAALTEIAGSSDVFDRGFVTYSNQSKQTVLGVAASTLERFGAVSEETARDMARGVIEHSDSDLAVAITGIAGPGGATPGKPIGLVHLAASTRDGRAMDLKRNYGAIGRTEVRLAAVRDALTMLGDLAAKYQHCD